MCPTNGGAVALYTIGHSNHPIDRFLAALGEHAIEVLIDVRSWPGSRWCPQFNRKDLQAALAQQRIQYQWRGPCLGGRGDTSIHAEGFLRDMGEVLRLAESQNVALLCSERHPRDCHRATKLVAWIHRHVPGTRAYHLLPLPEGPCEVIDSAALEEALDPARLWWELHPQGEYGRPAP